MKDGSKYGTFINSQRLTENTAVNLNSGDSVTFGVFESKFMYVPPHLLNSFILTADVHVNLNPFPCEILSLPHVSVEHLHPVVCSSCLDNNGKTLLSQSLDALGGELVNSWSLECTHLVMTSVKVTVKVKSFFLISTHDLDFNINITHFLLSQ